MSNNANGNKRVIFSGIAWCHGDKDFIVRTIARLDAAMIVTCSTGYGFSRDLQY